MKTCLKLKKRVTIYVSFFLIAGLVSLQGVAGAAVNMPAFDSLAPLAGTIIAPADVAIDQQGRSYVAETNKNRVTILSQSGNLVARLRVAAPVSVAVDANGNVSVFNSGLEFLFKLGNGDGEFGKPMDIAVDSAGIVYVVDNTNHAINTYNSSGARIGSIGSPGSLDGQLHHPVSIAIDENAGEIVVLDLQLVYDPTTKKYIDGARIQYFDMNGVSLRAYSKFGYNNAGQDWNNNGATTYDITMGQVTRPKQVAVDSMSRIYVTDARLQKVMVYDNADGFLGTLDNASSPFRIPMGLAMGASGRLYVASLFTKKVEVFGVDVYTAMAATPSVLEFNVVENDVAPPSQAVTVSNQGNAPINLTAEPQDGWVAAATTTNTLLATESGSINITVDPTGFAPGTYPTSIVVDTGAGALETININLIVKPNPLQVSDGALTFETSLGTTPEKQLVALSSASVEATSSVMSWEASADQSWISLDKMDGATTPDTVKVYVDMSTIDTPDTYTGTITFNQKGKTALIPVEVTLTVSGSDTPPGDVPGLGGSGKQKWNKKWTISQLLDGTTNLNGVSGTSKSDAFAVGDNGAILHFDGKDWTQENPVTANALNSVWSSSAAEVNAVGADGLVLKFNGTNWTEVITNGSNALLDVWGDSGEIVTVDEFGAIDGIIVDDVGVALRTVWATGDNVYFAGEAGTIYNSVDGNTPVPMTSNTTKWLNGVWASSSTDVFAVGENGTIIHYDGKDWSPMVSGVTTNINSVCGTSAADVYAVGDGSIILYYNGTAWTAMDAEVGVDLNDIWCSDKKDVIAVGDSGTVILGRVGSFPWNHVIQTIVKNAKAAKKGNK